MQISRSPLLALEKNYLRAETWTEILRCSSTASSTTQNSVFPSLRFYRRTSSDSSRTSNDLKGGTNNMERKSVISEPWQPFLSGWSYFLFWKWSRLVSAVIQSIDSILSIDPRWHCHLGSILNSIPIRLSIIKCLSLLIFWLGFTILFRLEHKNLLSWNVIFMWMEMSTYRSLVQVIE